MMNTRITNFEWQLRGVGKTEAVNVPAGGKITDAYPDKDLLANAAYAKIEAASAAKYSNSDTAKFTLPAKTAKIFPLAELSGLVFEGEDGAALDFAVQLLNEGA